MLLHCTRKLAAKRPEVSLAPLAESSPLESWHANLYHYDRRQCVLFCHDESRYCLFMPGRSRPTLPAWGGCIVNCFWRRR